MGVSTRLNREENTRINEDEKEMLEDMKIDISDNIIVKTRTSFIPRRKINPFYSTARLLSLRAPQSPSVLLSKPRESQERCKSAVGPQENDLSYFTSLKTEDQIQACIKPYVLFSQLKKTPLLLNLEAKKPLSYVPISESNMHDAKFIHEILFPIKYGDGFYMKFINDRLRNGYLVYSTSTLVGVVTLLVSEDRLYIMTLGILGQFRREGFGSNIVEYVRSIAQQKSLSGIMLHVHTENENAIKFYERNGFLRTGYVENYYNSIMPPHAYRYEFLFRSAITKNIDNKEEPWWKRIISCFFKVKAS